MAPKRSANSPAAEVGYEAYAAVVEIFSAGISDLVFNVVEMLADQKTFAREVERLAATQRFPSAATEDSTSLYHAFWTYAAGVDSDFRWLSNAGVTVHSAISARSVPNPVDPAAVPFRAGLGYGW
ncbi:hypothetical protein [Streptomyces sp. NRRL S-118]|uniref:hypothetical protein n=1 Tax=Streptomyces sp. NRRL S-118 TaxID=1463881 RepID=UPI00131CE17C|nr:hypothetical protein [Streptomyces sp. NRRL S-118]